MRVVIPLASSSSQISGVQRHAINVARCLLTRDEISAVHLVAAPWQQEFVRNSSPSDDPRLHLHPASIGSGATSRNLWYYFQLPRLAAELRADIVHLAYPAPLRGNAFRVPTVVTLHDLYPFDIPDNFGFPRVLINQIVLRQCLAAVNAIACVSHSTLSNLGQFDPALVRRKARVICNCVEAHPGVSARSPLPRWGGQPFLLCVAQHRRNKNILFLLRVFKSLLRKGQLPSEIQLVIIGIEGPETKLIRRFLSEADIAGRVVLLSGLTEAELQWCYRNCSLLLAPSTVEGFGLPVAEALLAGCPIVCSDISAFREVGGDHCSYIPLNSRAEEAFMDAVYAVFNAPHPAPVELPELAPPVIAEKYLQLYRALLCRTTPASERGQQVSINTSRKGMKRMNNQESVATAKVLGVSVEALNMERALRRIATELRRRRKGYVCFANVHGIMEAHSDPCLAAIYASASITMPDGAPTAWVGRWQGQQGMQRVAGPELMLEVFGKKELAGYTHFLYGGKEGVAQQLRECLTSRFPGARVVGTFTPPFRDLNEAEEISLIARVRQLKPDIIWVGISTPKQERFMHRYLPQLETTLMFGVGAAFDFHTGRIHDAPQWVKRVGMQWLHRLMQDPRHLWKRYLRTNSAFLWHIALQLSGFRKYPPTEIELGSWLSAMPRDASGRG